MIVESMNSVFARGGSMSAVLEKIWPPTRTWRRSILWSLSCGFVLQIAVPTILALLGAQRAALFAMLPGLWPILWATGGWFAGISPLGYLLMYSINTLAYAVLLLAGFRTCTCMERRPARVQ
jgi:hypothetical protein